MRYLKSITSMIQKLNYILEKKEVRNCYIVIILLIIGSLLETLGVSAILPFIEVLLTPEKVMGQWYIKPFVDLFHIQTVDTVIIMVGIGIIFIYLIKNLYLYTATTIHTIFRSKVQKNLSTKMLRTYMNRSYEYYININTAEVMRGISVDVIGIYNLMDNLFRFIGELFTAMLISVYIIYTDAFMALCIIAIAGSCFSIIVLGLKKKTKYLGEQKRITNTVRDNCAYQAIMGFKEVKVTQTTDHFIKDYDNAYDKLRVAEVKNECIQNVPERIIEALCVATLIGVVCIKVKMGSNLDTFIPKLAIFAVAAFRLLPSVSRMTRYMNGIIFNNTFMQSVYTNLKEINQYLEGEHNEEKTEDIPYEPFHSHLIVQDLDWKYEGSDKYILQDLSLEISKGESVAFIGSSGAGKTTLSDIILGLLKPKKGKITVDGKDIFKNPKMWGRMIGYVPQNIFLSDDTIRNNVAFGQDEDKIDEQRVWKALEQAQFSDFIKQLPEGLETQVGERGIKFSGGQRQRIAIARTLYYNPDIIILDEATSALDNETEKAVMEAIDSLQGYKTLIIVAHRLSTIRNCQKIYEICEGQARLKDKSELF